MIWLEQAHGYLDGSPALLVTTMAIRFKTVDEPGIDDQGPVIAPEAPIRTCEQWLRIVSDGGEIRNVRLVRSGSLPRNVTDYWGQTTAYQQPSTEVRIATVALSERVMLAPGPFTQPGPLGPWLVLQWEIKPGVIIGRQNPVTYRITYDAY